MEVQLIECGKIDVPKVSNDLRTFSKEFAVKMADSIKCEGLYCPIAVRPNPASPGRYILISGKHRLYATKNVLKEMIIASNVIEDMDEAEAEMAMIAENLWRNPLTKPQHALSIKKWWTHFQAKNPDRAVQGAAGRAAAKARKKKVGAAGEGAVALDSEEAKQERADIHAAETATDAEQGQTAAEANAAIDASFASTVAATTGQSARSAARSIKIAKSFTEEQLEAFVQMEVSQNDMLTIAKIKDQVKRDEVVNLIASGMEPSAAIAEVMKDAAPIREGAGSKATAESKAAATAEKAPEMTDDEWFTTYCGEKAGMLGDPARFKSDALLFRKLTDHRHSFRCKAKKAVKATAEAGTKGSFWNLVNRLISISHPKSWFLCELCKGTGKTPYDSNGSLEARCAKCYGGGYTMKTEEYL